MIRPDKPSVISALAAMTAVLLITCLLALGARNSRIYQHGVVLGFIARQEQVSLLALVTNPEKRSVMTKFIGATTAAYLDFEMLPYGGAQTFTAVFSSLGEGIAIEGFEYRRRDLMISGFADSPEAFDGFISRLEEAGHFASVVGYEYPEEQDKIPFEIWCISSHAIPAVLI